MLDSNKLFHELFDTQIMDETNLGIPVEPSDYKQMASGKQKTKNGWHIVLRVKAGGAGRSGSSSQHGGCSIKIQNNTGFNMKIVIPNKPYDMLASTDIAVRDLVDFYNKADKTVRNLVRFFIYDNQMAIIAYWFTPNNENELIAKALFDHMRNSIITKRYDKNTITKSKSQDELENDKVMLNEYVQQKLDDSSIELYFGS